MLINNIKYIMEIEVFTDGSFIKNKYGNIKCGYGVYFPNNELPNISESLELEPKTNQRAELYAIYVALKNIIDNLNFKQINIYTDSEYSLNSLTKWAYNWEKNGWIGSNKKDIKNQDIIKPTFDILKKYKGMINIIHVYSHTGKKDKLSINNDIADKLAVDGANKTINNNTNNNININTNKNIKQKRTTKNKKSNEIVELNFDYSKIKILKIGNKNVIVK